MSTVKRTPMDAFTADLSVACGGTRFYRRVGTEGMIARARTQETVNLVCARASRVADVPAALRAALIEAAPGVARHHREAAAEKRARAAAILADAENLEAEAVKIEDALKAAQKGGA